MKIIFIIAFLVFTVLGAIGVFIGLNPRKWYSWLVCLFGFLAGLMIGLLREDIKGGLGMGVFFGLAVLFSGTTIYLQRKRYEDAAETWLLQHGQTKRFSLLSRLIKLLKKGK